MYSAKYGLGKDQNRLLPSPVAWRFRWGALVFYSPAATLCWVLTSFCCITRARRIIRMRPKTLNLAVNFVKAAAVCLKIALRRHLVKKLIKFKNRACVLSPNQRGATNLETAFPTTCKILKTPEISIYILRSFAQLLASARPKSRKKSARYVVPDTKNSTRKRTKPGEVFNRERDAKPRVLHADFDTDGARDPLIKP